MKITLIGPINPYKSGESQSNTMLCENLSKPHKVEVFSFKRLYPHWAYPVKSQTYESAKKVSFNKNFIIDSINPFNWITSFIKIKNSKPDLVIVTWWTVFLAPCYFVILSLLKMFTKTKVCIFAHNVYPHEKSILNRILATTILSIGNYFIVFSSKTMKDLKQLFPNAKADILIETTYNNYFKQNTISKDKAREKLGITGNIVLFFGLIREYKGLRYLIEAIPHVLKKVDVKFLIVGEFWENKEKYLKLINSFGVQENVIIIDRFVPDEEAVYYFTAIDIFVLPYISTTYSALVPLAYGYNKPVIVSNILGLTDLVDDGKTGYVVPSENPRELANAIIRFFKENKQKEFEKNIKEKKKIFEWNIEKENLVLGTKYD